MTVCLPVGGDGELNRGFELPLVVDLDGTLIKTDSFIENFLTILRKNPLRFFIFFLSILQGKSVFKSRMADMALPDPVLYPYNQAVLGLIQEARGRGGKVFLATAANERIARDVHDHLGLFDGLFASTRNLNLSGKAKADLLVQQFGAKGFDYIGDHVADLPVWDHARRVYVVDPSQHLRRVVQRRYPGSTVLSERTNSLSTYARAARVHQWIKNILIFLPALAGHVFSTTTWGTLLLGFAAFSFCASSVYLLNDMLDLRSDRLSNSKRLRPFAAGTIPLSHGLLLVPFLLVVSLGLGFAVSVDFLMVLMGYYALTFTYSFVLKRLAMLDVVALCCLYGIRMIAGSVAASVPLSHWFAAFAMFLFFFLALIKRATELTVLKRAGSTGTSGRGYRADDLGVIESMAAGSGFVSVLVLALYVSSMAGSMLYGHPERLWAGCLVMIYWVGHLLLTTHRGDMNEDPVVFAVTDSKSLICGLAMALIVGFSL
jgi:4-hydroxybenzoate polyprenyltransferase